MVENQSRFDTLVDAREVYRVIFLKVIYKVIRGGHDVEIDSTIP